VDVSNSGSNLAVGPVLGVFNLRVLLPLVTKYVNFDPLEPYSVPGSRTRLVNQLFSASGNEGSSEYFRLFYMLSTA
jgi:hypothetical protein